MSTVIAMYNLLEKSDASIFNCIIMDFKIGDIVNHRDYGDTLFEVVYISRGSVMIYSNEWASPCCITDGAKPIIAQDFRIIIH